MKIEDIFQIIPFENVFTKFQIELYLCEILSNGKRDFNVISYENLTNFSTTRINSAKRIISKILKFIHNYTYIKYNLKSNYNFSKY